MFVNSLKYLTKFKLSVSLAKWIYEELSIMKYTDVKLLVSFAKHDLDISRSIIHFNKNTDVLNSILISVVDVPTVNEDLESNIKLLIDHGADIDTENCKILNYAIFLNHIDIVQLLLKFNPKKNRRTITITCFFERTELKHLLFPERTKNESC